MTPKDYRDVVQKLTKPLSEEERKIEMLAMFLCDSMIVPLGSFEKGGRFSGGHGWHRATSWEREQYRLRATVILNDLDMTKITEGNK